MPKISLVMPIYNGEKTLNRSIDAILNQTFENFELILVNDGSKDKTKTICEKYTQIDNRIKLINKKNEGAGPARNKGIEIAQGEYIMFPDCDDWMECTMVEKLYQSILDNNSDLAICLSKNYNKKEKVITNNKNCIISKVYKNREELRVGYIELLENNLILGPSDKLYNLNIIKSKSIKFPNLRRSQDIVFNMDYIKNINRANVLNEELYNYVVPDKKDMLNKIPENYFDIVNTLVDKWLIIKNKWGGDKKAWNQYLGDYILSGVHACIYMILNNKNFTYKEKNKYVKKIITSNIVKEILDNYESNDKKRKIFAYLLRKEKEKATITLVQFNRLLG